MSAKIVQHSNASLLVGGGSAPHHMLDGDTAPKSRDSNRHRHQTGFCNTEQSQNRKSSPPQRLPSDSTPGSTPPAFVPKALGTERCGENARRCELRATVAAVFWRVSNQAMKHLLPLLILAAGALHSQEISKMTAPAVIQRADPEYTAEATEAKIEGAVVLSMVIDTAGVPTEIHLVRGLGLGLDEKAVECLQRWRFRPATRFGQAIPMKATVEINFRLGPKAPNRN